MVPSLSFIRVVQDLDVPWKVTSDGNGDDMILVREGAPLTRPLVNVIIGMIEERMLIMQLRSTLEDELLRVEVLPVPESRSEGAESEQACAPMLDRAPLLSSVNRRMYQKIKSERGVG